MWSIKGNIMKNCGVGININGAPDNMDIDGNCFEACNEGIRITYSLAAKLTDIDISRIQSCIKTSITPSEDIGRALTMLEDAKSSHDTDRRINLISTALQLTAPYLPNIYSFVSSLANAMR
ncbi:MAG: hypothetical protein RIN56_20300 [Sporomusaceae bacterium]|nr:hypothetical protein [Sporomusaceae bacterium]